MRKNYALKLRKQLKVMLSTNSSDKILKIS